MQTVEIQGKLTTTPQFSEEHSGYTFKFEYQPKHISQALALARPPIPAIIEFRVVVSENLLHKVETLKAGDACVLVYPQNPQVTAPLSPIDIKKANTHSEKTE